MKSISKHILIEDDYAGVTLGLVNQPRGLLLIDAPPAPEEGRAWRAAMLGLKTGQDRMLIALDAHPDRTLGAKGMDCPLIAQNKTAQVIRTRPSTFKTQGSETGAEWESIVGLGTARWTQAEITFSHELHIQWGDLDVEISHHPGPTPGATWVTVAEEKIVFIGDLVTRNQPPFLAHADLSSWIAGIEFLLGAEHKGYTFVAGRGGVVTTAQIRTQLDLLHDIEARIEKLGLKSKLPDSTESLVEPILEAMKVPVARRKAYSQRLRYGLRQCFARKYQAGPTAEE